MPLLKINADGTRPVLHGPGDLEAELAQAIRALPALAPVMILIHGYRFSPYATASNPHCHILSLEPRAGCRKALSWPRNLGFGRGADDKGLCIAFGWEARGSIWRAWHAGAEAGTALATLIHSIRKLRPGRVDILCHSLGARVGLSALANLPARSVGRVVLMAAAEYRGAALGALGTSAGKSAEFINVTSRENDPFDAMIEWLVRPQTRSDKALGTGLGQKAANWLDLQMDCPRTIEVLRDLGYRIPAPSRRICHWSAYLRPGLFRFYRDLIRDPDLLHLGRIAGLLPDQPTARWSRLLQVPQMSFGVRGKAPRSLADLLTTGLETHNDAHRAARLITGLQVFRSRILRTSVTGP